MTLSLEHVYLIMAFSVVQKPCFGFVHILSFVEISSSGKHWKIQRTLIYSRKCNRVYPAIVFQTLLMSESICFSLLIKVLFEIIIGIAACLDSGDLKIECQCSALNAF